jgi:lipopolysaccharide kinase (Kdo/WaaP) family protein
MRCWHSEAALREALAQLDFQEIVLGRSRFYLAQQIAGDPESISRHLKPIAAGAPAAGNRRSAMRLNIAGLPPMYARRSRRGGLMRYLVSELYAGIVPRPLRELVITATARQRGLPVVQPLGAVVEWVGPWLYRGWFLSAALEGQTLWELLLSGPDEQTRREALVQTRAAIERLHQGGLYHADLNLHNFFVCVAEPALRVVLLDLDKSRLYPSALAAGLRRSNFARLARSAQKLARCGVALSEGENKMLGFV